MFIKSVLIPGKTNTDVYNKTLEAVQFFKSQIDSTNQELKQTQTYSQGWREIANTLKHITDLNSIDTKLLENLFSDLPRSVDAAIDDELIKKVVICARADAGP